MLTRELTRNSQLICIFRNTLETRKDPGMLFLIAQHSREINPQTIPFIGVGAFNLCLFHSRPASLQLFTSPAWFSYRSLPILKSCMAFFLPAPFFLSTQLTTIFNITEENLPTKPTQIPIMFFSEFLSRLGKRFQTASSHSPLFLDFLFGLEIY